MYDDLNLPHCISRRSRPQMTAIVVQIKTTVDTGCAVDVCSLKATDGSEALGKIGGMC